MCVFSECLSDLQVPIGADLRDDAWRTTLCDHGYNKGLPSIWLVEGLFIYLQQETIETILQKIAVCKFHRDFTIQLIFIYQLGYDVRFVHSYIRLHECQLSHLSPHQGLPLRLRAEWIAFCHWIGPDGNARNLYEVGTLCVRDSCPWRQRDELRWESPAESSSSGATV